MKKWGQTRKSGDRPGLSPLASDDGTSYAESLMADTGGLSLSAAQWIYVASLSEARPRGLSKEELAEYMAAPGVDISGLGPALEELARNCWYLDQLRSGRFFFNKVKIKPIGHS